MKILRGFLFCLIVGQSNLALSEVPYGPKGDSLTFTPFIGIYQHGKRQDLITSRDKTSKIWHTGVRLGWAYSPELEFEGSFGYTKTRTAIDIQDVYLWGVNGLFQYLYTDKWAPYATLGVGMIEYDEDFRGRSNQFDLNYGIGLKWFLFRNLALRPDIRAVTTFDSPHTAVVGTFNFTYYAAL